MFASSSAKGILQRVFINELSVREDGDLTGQLMLMLKRDAVGRSFL
jgi:hypothetical protein